VEHAAPAILELGLLLLLAALAGKLALRVGLPAVLADVGVVLLSPLQVLITWVLSGAACMVLGMNPAGAAIVGLSIAMSSSVVVVNITRSQRRTTDPATDEELLGWSLIQDLVGVASALVLCTVIGLGGRSGLVAAAGVVAFGLIGARGGQHRRILGARARGPPASGSSE
jgi:monovalent cation:H+ antiporter-2, CPA2 family